MSVPPIHSNHRCTTVVLNSHKFLQTQTPTPKQTKKVPLFFTRKSYSPANRRMIIYSVDPIKRTTLKNKNKSVRADSSLEEGEMEVTRTGEEEYRV
jgi:hypothetical protein